MASSVPWQISLSSGDQPSFIAILVVVGCLVVVVVLLFHGIPTKIFCPSSCPLQSSLLGAVAASCAKQVRGVNGECGEQRHPVLLLVLLMSILMLVAVVDGGCESGIGCILFVEARTRNRGEEPAKQAGWLRRHCTLLQLLKIGRAHV